MTMRRICMLTLLCFITQQHIFAQQGPGVVVSADRMNIMYRGIPNPISFACSNWATESIEISVSGSNKIECPSPGNCLVTPTSNFAVHLVDIYFNYSDGEQNLTDTATFRIKKTPDPSISFSGKRANQSTINKWDAMSARGLGAAYVNFDFDVNVTVTSFWLGIGKNGEYRYFESEGNKISEEMERALQMVEDGNQLWIGSAEVEMPDKTTRSLDEEIGLTIIE